MAVQSSFKKYEFKEIFENMFPSTFEAVLYIFRKEFPNFQIIEDGQSQDCSIFEEDEFIIMSNESERETEERIKAVVDEIYLVAKNSLRFSDKDSENKTIIS